MFNTSFARRGQSALVALALLTPLVACDQAGLLAPAQSVDPLAGALEGESTAFEDHVREVDLERSVLVLESGLHVRVTDSTAIDLEREVTSLEQTAHLLREGVAVVAWGSGTVESEDPPVLVADSLAMAVAEDQGGEDPPPSSHVAFEGVVSAVSLDAGTLTFDDGRVIRVVDETAISDDHGVPSLAAAKEHLEAGATLVAWGEGELESEDPVVIVALSLVMKVRE